jgi:acyl-ACP thioesterase
MLFWHTGMPVSVFAQTSAVGFFDVDPLLRFSPPAYWRILQNAAAAHANELGAATEQLRREGQTWMLSRMVLEVDRHPSLGDALTVETWPSTLLRGVRAVRDFAVKDSAGDLVARASSLWVIVDLATRRPQRVPEAIAALRTDPGYPIPAFTPTLEAVVAPDSRRHFTAEWSDCDQNEHVNNVSYVRWAVDALPRALLESHSLHSIEVHYLREIALGATVALETERKDAEARQSLYLATGEVAAAFCHRWRVAG